MACGPSEALRRKVRCRLELHLTGGLELLWTGSGYCAEGDADQEDHRQTQVEGISPRCTAIGDAPDEWESEDDHHAVQQMEEIVGVFAAGEQDQADHVLEYSDNLGKDEGAEETAHRLTAD